MEHVARSRSILFMLCALIVALASAIPITAQTVSGQAQAVKTVVVNPLGGSTTTVLADTGPLGSSADARQASAQEGSVSSLVAVNTLHATSIGWPDQVKSEASVADLAITVAGTSVGADFVMARASSVLGTPASANVSINGLMLNGTPITVTGNPNQTISVPGGQLVINEQPSGSSGTVVNALHLAVAGVADVVVASATARVQ